VRLDAGRGKGAQQREYRSTGLGRLVNPVVFLGKPV